MELNKLKLTEHKSAKIHVVRKNSDCPTLKVHSMNMKNSLAEKYLGDIVSETGTLDETIRDNKFKGYTYISEIRALMSDIPFGNRRIEIGIMLRDAMFANGIQTNSEVWHSIMEKKT